MENTNDFRRLEDIKTNAVQWLKDQNIKAFFTAVPNKSLDKGAFSIITAGGLGKLVPNMVLLGYKNNWVNDLENLDSYFNIIYQVFDMHLAVGILRLKDGCDYSSYIGRQENIMIPTEGEEVSDEGMEVFTQQKSNLIEVLFQNQMKPRLKAQLCIAWPIW